MKAGSHWEPAFSLHQSRQADLFDRGVGLAPVDFHQAANAVKRDVVRQRCIQCVWQQKRRFGRLSLVE